LDDLAWRLSLRVRESVKESVVIQGIVGSLASTTRRLLLRDTNANIPEAAAYPPAPAVTPVAHAMSVEFLTASLLTAVTTSMLTARANNRALKFDGSISHYFPEAPLAFRDMASCDESVFFGRSMTRGLATFYAELGKMRSGLSGDAAFWQPQTTDHKHRFGDLSQNWRALCGESRLVLLALCELDCLAGTDQSARLYEIEEFIRNAWYGDVPCIRADGQVIVPGWLDQRRDTRIPIGVAIWIQTKHGRQRAVLRDVSVAGFGLSACHGLAMGTEVFTELPDSTRINGTIIWSHGGSVGVRFAERLPETSPVFRAAMALSRLTRGKDRTG
jgi:hypothetical protein